MAEQRPGNKASGESVPEDGATGIFGAFEGGEREAVKPAMGAAPVSAVPTPVPVAAPPTLDAAGFTQLLRALVPEPAVLPVPTEAARVADAVSYSDRAVQPKPAPAAPSSSGFTDVFGVQNGGNETSETRWPRSDAPPSPSPTAGPVFSSPSSGSWPAIIPVVPSSGHVSGQFPATAAFAPVPKAAPAGEFTQLFQGFNSKPVEAEPVFSSPLHSPPVGAPVPMPANLPGADSGGFTQLIRALDPSKGPTARVTDIAFHSPAVALHPPAAVPPTQAVATESRRPGESSGSFTQLFQPLSPASTMLPPQPMADPTPLLKSAPAGDNFTGLYSSLGADPGRSASQADSFPPIAPQHGAAAFYPVPDALARPVAPRYPEPVYTPPTPLTPPSPAGSSLTQMMRVLEDTSAVAGRPVAQPPANAPRGETQAWPGQYPEPVWRAPPSGPPNVTQNQYSYPEAAAAVAPPVQSGPGEFTRMIGAAQLRELERVGRQGGAGAATAGPSAAAPAQSHMPALQYPAVPSLPSIPSLPGFPSMPNAPSVPSAGQGGSWPMPVASMQMQAPQVPAMPAPPAPAVPQPGGLAKAWVPVLLIVIIVLLVGILAAVLLMKK